MKRKLPYLLLAICIAWVLTLYAMWFEQQAQARHLSTCERNFSENPRAYVCVEPKS